MTLDENDVGAFASDVLHSRSAETRRCAGDGNQRLAIETIHRLAPHIVDEMNATAATSHVQALNGEERVARSVSGCAMLVRWMTSVGRCASSMSCSRWTARIRTSQRCPPLGPCRFGSGRSCTSSRSPMTRPSTPTGSCATPGRRSVPTSSTSRCTWWSASTPPDADHGTLRELGRVSGVHVDQRTWTRRGHRHRVGHPSGAAFDSNAAGRGGPLADRPGHLVDRPLRRPSRWPEPLSVVEGSPRASTGRRSQRRCWRRPLGGRQRWVSRLSVLTVAEDVARALDGTRPNRFGPADPQRYVTELADRWRQHVDAVARWPSIRSVWRPVWPPISPPGRPRSWH